ncbi:hypothetical protein PV11_00865 [Exophiala sideris]|uniref:Uncharacterized protein n=1 Tax=Exophiala sideris TaxID=1016849 RepID=A0A0D1W8P9_9EURO|nr:hypothetical protein PV11_00865 [Exophiala sideris]
MDNSQHRVYTSSYRTSPLAMSSPCGGREYGYVITRGKSTCRLPKYRVPQNPDTGAIYTPHSESHGDKQAVFHPIPDLTPSLPARDNQCDWPLHNSRHYTWPRDELSPIPTLRHGTR